MFTLLVKKWTNFYPKIFVLLSAHLFVDKSLFILLHKCLLKKFVRLYEYIFVQKVCSLFYTPVCVKFLFDYKKVCSYIKLCSYKWKFVCFTKGCSKKRMFVRLCTRFPPTFQKLFENSSVRVPLRFQEFFKSKFFRSFSKSRVYVYSFSQKIFLKVSFLKESLSKNVYVYRDEHMFEKSNKISDGLFYYIINTYIL